MIDGLFDEKAIADRFANVFESVSVPNSLNTHKTLKSQILHVMLNILERTVDL